MVNIKAIKKILAIDPGNEKSAYVLLEFDTYKPIEFGLVENNELLNIIKNTQYDHLAIEMVMSYGMSVGYSVFETCLWIGRYIQLNAQKKLHYTKIYRMDEKVNICHVANAKDTNIRTALIDRFGVVGTKKNPGFFYGFKKDIWAAYAVGITFIDLYKLNGDLPVKDYFERRV